LIASNFLITSREGGSMLVKGKKTGLKKVKMDDIMEELDDGEVEIKIHNNNLSNRL
jgi:hypothetical protein